MENKELTEKVSSLRTYIEKKINFYTEIHFDAEVYFDEVRVSMMGSDNYRFRIFIKRNIKGERIGLKYSIPSWGAIDPNEFNRLFGGEKFVMVYRDRGVDFKEKVLMRYKGLDESTWKSYEGYPEGYSIGWMYDELRKPTFDDLVFSLWNHTDFSEPKDPSENIINENTVPEHGDIEFVDYSEKSFVVTGDTKPIKDILKGLGGKFRKGFTCGAGWVFPKTKYESVKEALNS